MSAGPPLPGVPPAPAVSYPMVLVDDIDDAVWIDSWWREPVALPVIPAPRTSSPQDGTTGPELPALAG